ncbi:MAG: hypothetical protein ACT4PZ_04610 [Panacagrimonas sp.]
MATKEGVENGTSALEKGLGVLERAWEIQWALRALCLVLFVDAVMLVRNKHGLLQWSTNDMALLSDLGLIAVLVAAFSFTVAIVAPFIVIVLRPLGAMVWGWMPAFLRSSDDRPFQRPLGRVPACAFRDLALHQNSDFLLRIYEAEQKIRLSDRLTRERIGQLMAATLLAALADWLFARSISGGIGLVGAFVDVLGAWAPEVIGAMLLYVGAALKWAWFPEVQPELIYDPPLDQELREKERKARVPY